MALDPLTKELNNVVIEDSCDLKFHFQIILFFCKYFYLKYMSNTKHSMKQQYLKKISLHVEVKTRDTARTRG